MSTTAPPPARYVNVSAFTCNGVGFSSIKSVMTNAKGKYVHDSGDNDQFASFGANAGGAEVTVDVEIGDPIQALALKGTAGIVTFTGVPQVGNQPVTVTISGVSFASIDVGAKHGAVWTQKVSGGAFKADGTNPISMAVGTGS